MRKLETVYKIELTNEEVETLVLALQNEYTDIKERIATVEAEVETPENSRRLSDMNKLKSNIRRLRNDLGSLIGRTYMAVSYTHLTLPTKA